MAAAADIVDLLSGSLAAQGQHRHATICSNHIDMVIVAIVQPEWMRMLSVLFATKTMPLEPRFVQNLGSSVQSLGYPLWRELRC